MNLIDHLLTFGSLFAGCGTFDLGLERAGMRGVWQCELDATCRSVLERHWPDVPQHDDVRTLHVSRKLVRPDLIVGGWPCQGNSVAGRRAGMADERSGLWSEVKRVLAEFTPRWFLGENVPGALSVNGGQDWLTVLRDLAELGYGFAYRVLDAQWFGVPQRRRRVFVVGCLGDWRSAAEVLFERDSLPWNPPPSRQARTRVAGTIDAGAGVRRGAGINPSGITETAACLNSGGNNGGFRTEPGEHLVAHPLKAGGNSRHDESHETYLVIGEHHARRERESVARGLRGSDCGVNAGRLLASTDVVGPLCSHSKEHGHGMTTQQAVEAGQLIPTLAHALTATATATATATGRLDPNGETFIPEVMTLAIRGREDESRLEYRSDGTANAILTPNGGRSGMGVGAIASARSGVRRLTPRECERLQGLPDDWTRYDATGKELSDSKRYHMIGNAGAVPVLEWIGKRIVEAAGTL